jgi:hypothetical protein
MGNRVDQLPDALHHPGIQIAMQIGQLQEPETLEGRWQSRKGDLHRFDPDIEDIPLPASFHPGNGKDAVDAGVDRDKAFEGKDSQSLADLPAPESLLKFQALLRFLRAQSSPDRFGDGEALGVHRDPHYDITSDGIQKKSSPVG